MNCDKNMTYFAILSRSGLCGRLAMTTDSNPAGSPTTPQHSVRSAAAAPQLGRTWAFILLQAQVHRLSITPHLDTFLFDRSHQLSCSLPSPSDVLMT